MHCWTELQTSASLAYGESQCFDGMVPEVLGKSRIRHSDPAYMGKKRRRKGTYFAIRKNENQRASHRREGMSQAQSFDRTVPELPASHSQDAEIPPLRRKGKRCTNSRGSTIRK